MKIQRIQCEPTTNGTNFKGVWGEGTSDYTHDSMGTYTYNKKFYYPFSDETASEIDAVVKRNSSHYETCPGKNVVPEPITHYTYTDVMVKERLPFTKAEYAAYKNKNISNATKKLIETTLEKIKKVRFFF